LRLEHLEDRLAPAFLDWTGGGGGDCLVSNSQNWTVEGTGGHALPSSADTLVFPRAALYSALVEWDQAATSTVSGIRFEDVDQAIKLDESITIAGWGLSEDCDTITQNPAYLGHFTLTLSGGNSSLNGGQITDSEMGQQGSPGLFLQP
jgi:hypothetical protein